MKKAVVLVSGGMDSCVTLAVALKEWDVFPLHMNYGYRTEGRELKSFKKILSFYEIKNNLVVDIDYLRILGGSSLTDFSLSPEKGIPKHGNIPSTYVPFRNTHLLAIAVSYAEVIEASKIFIGAVETDSSGYPDCRKEYIETFNELIKVGSKRGSEIEVVAPLINMSKREIVEKGMELGVPFHMTWSCYVGNDVSCGECQSCYLRLKAFREAGARDPLEYKKRSS